ncbi:MAG: hypothetical protein H7257_11040 [Taibaiella sp.]|nr:hypothetical protein [Taibaiella sp.]
MSKAGIIFFLCFTCFVQSSFSQDLLAEYGKYIHSADSLYQVKQYGASANTYHLAFQILGGKGYSEDRYNAARSWSLAKNKDSAFYNLWRIATTAHFGKYFELKNEKDFNSLHTDKRWQPILDTVKKNRIKSYSSYNVQICEILDSMVEVDQRTRNKLSHISGDATLENQITEEVAQADRRNYPLLESLFKQYGYLGINKVGANGENNFLLLVQHQDKHIAFQESVLAEMSIEIAKNNAKSKNYANLEDQIKINSGQLQIYGTQIRMNEDSTSYELMPCIDPEQLNERRKTMGLTTVEKYIEIVNERSSNILRKKK